MLCVSVKCVYSDEVCGVSHAPWSGVVACKPTGAQVEGGSGENEENQGPQRNSALLGVSGM